MQTQNLMSKATIITAALDPSFFMEKTSIITMALDTSNTNTGFSIWVNGKYLSSGNLINDDDLELWQKTDMMIKQIRAMFLEYKPDIVVTESLNVDNNQKVNSAHSEVLGAVKAFCLVYGSHYYDYSPHDWRVRVNTNKETLPRKRKELKIWDIKRAKEYFKEIGFDLDYDIDDNEADGVLIGLAYMNQFLEDKNEV